MISLERIIHTRLRNRLIVEVIEGVDFKSSKAIKGSEASVRIIYDSMMQRTLSKPFASQIEWEECFMFPISENNNSNVIKIDFLAEDKNTEFILANTQITFNRDSHGIQYFGVLLGDPEEVEERLARKFDPMDPQRNSVLLSSVILGSANSFLLPNEQKGIKSQLMPPS